jgi:hypothetical protein
MGLEIGTLLAIGSAASGVVSLVQGVEARKDARRNMRNAAEQDKKIQAETKAQQAQRAAEERRAQIREERVRRARVLAGAEASGASGSSGEFGALGALSTNLGSNIGSNLGRLAAGERTSGYAQAAADFRGSAENKLSKAQQSDQLFDLSAKVFSASDGVNQIKSIFD